MASKKLSELTSLSEVTNGDLFMVTDDTSGASRRVSWSDIKGSIPASELDDISDVDLTTAAPSDGSALIYDSSSGNWVPGEASEIEGSSPVKGVTYTYSTTISAGATAGQVRFNSTIPAGANLMYIYDTDVDGIDHTPALASLFSQNVTFIMRSKANTAQYVKYVVTAAPTDYGRYFAVPIRHKESSSFPSNGAKAAFTLANNLYALEDPQDFTLSDNSASALVFKQDSTDYVTISTANSAEQVVFHQDVELNKAFDIISDSDAQVRLKQYSSNNGAPDISFYKSRGTEDSPSTVGSGDGLSRHIAYGYDGSQFIIAGSLGFAAADGAGNGNFTLKTRVSDTLGTRISVNNSGNTSVSGDLAVSGGLNVGTLSTYADNTAAKAAGLANGDLYRKSDGTLMVAYE